MDAIATQHRGRVGLGLAVLVVVLAADQATKVAALRLLEPGLFVPLVSDSVGWELVRNPGAAFGLPLPPELLSGIALVVGFGLIFAMRSAHRRIEATAFGLLAAGALGNLVDRVVRAGDVGDGGFLHGHVVDFIAVGAFPRFNLADIAINVGVGLLLIDLLMLSTTPDQDGERLLHDLGTGDVGPSSTVRVFQPEARSGVAVLPVDEDPEAADDRAPDMVDDDETGPANGADGRESTRAGDEDAGSTDDRDSESAGDVGSGPADDDDGVLAEARDTSPA